MSRSTTTTTAAQARRNALIVQLHGAGLAPDALADLTAKSRRQINRILAAGSVADGPPPARLGPLEKRDLIRIHRMDPKALEWLHAQPTDPDQDPGPDPLDEARSLGVLKPIRRRSP